jgi:RimJ/RimL family protein N-acetyltransferase
MNPQPTLETARLRLRPFILADAERASRLAGAREIADTTVSIPHPYTVELAMQWIEKQGRAFQEGKAVHFAIEAKQEPGLIGGIGLREVNVEHPQAELGVWIGVNWWGRGYALEATVAVVDYGFRTMGLNRVSAHHMTRNPASGRVLERAGFQREGLLREFVRKWGVFEDVVVLGILRRDWVRGNSPARGGSA